MYYTILVLVNKVHVVLPFVRCKTVHSCPALAFPSQCIRFVISYKGRGCSAGEPELAVCIISAMGDSPVLPVLLGVMPTAVLVLDSVSSEFIIS